ncbi:NAC domain-containing protein 83-like [Senna tora]|uniref:NAC domain-containing protein 83-like n=1 Tax=Senna tora TaxID=362788 RepID=A0A834SDZ5_9FABA|nr:NAC domain-containing protein 83-like [Senna tora]
MENFPSFVLNGGVKVPIGYRFCPTDEELVVHYLRKKVFSQPLPASVIPEFDVFQTHPRGLPGVVGMGDSREKGYFFCNRKKENLHGKVIVKIPGGSGYWKPTGKDKLIVTSRTNHVVGTRKTLVFCEPKRSSCEPKTRWVMHQLRLVVHPFQMPLADWAVYRIFLKKKKLKGKGSNNNNNITQLFKSRKVHNRLEEIEPNFIDFTTEEHGGCDHEGPPPPPSPCFSEGSDIFVSNKLD